MKSHQFIPCYNSIYDLPVIYVCGKGEVVPSDKFLCQLFILSDALYPGISSPQSFLSNLREKLIKDGEYENDELELFKLPVPIEYMSLVRGIFQLSPHTKNLYMYSLFHILASKMESFKAIFVEDFNWTTLEPMKFKNVFYLEIECD